MEPNEACPHRTDGVGPVINFTYNALQGDKATRLLELQPGQPCDDVHCKILYSALNSGKCASPSYIALSYVWGPPEFEEFIFCDNGSDDSSRIHVTHNLYGALRALRREAETRTLWIDQICINQADDEEKCSQIQIMKEIYSQADGEIAWGG